MAEEIMFEKFYINKNSGTYSEALEAFGLADLIDKILDKNNVRRRRVIIKDTAEGRYLIEPETPITQAMVENLSYFQVIKFIKKDAQTVIPEGIGNEYFDYPEQKRLKEEQKKKFDEINKSKQLTDKQRKNFRKGIKEEIENEFGKAIVVEFEVIRQITGKPYASFTKTYQNFHQNKNHFQKIVKNILSFYSYIKYNEKIKVTKEVTSQQLYAPNQGKGLNKLKANSATMRNLPSFWITEAMKTVGAYNILVCQYLKSADLKLYVPEVNEINIQEFKPVMVEFRKHLKANDPIKLDVLNLLLLLKHFILNSKEFQGKVRNTIRGLHAVYQKYLGSNWVVANISFLEVPGFIAYENQQQAQEWLNFIDHQHTMIKDIKEQGDAIQGLLAYRNFISGGNIQSFFNFTRWYSTYLMQRLAKASENEKSWMRKIQFNYPILNKIFENMENINLQAIITNQGFQAVAKAIRYTTVKIQYNKDYWNKQLGFDIHYGLAQQLANKSKSEEDLIPFIGEFIGKYNAETAAVLENLRKRNPEARPPRANVKKELQDEFYLLLANNSSKLIGALLSSYGFALTSESKNIDVDIPEEEEIEEPEITEPIE